MASPATTPYLTLQESEVEGKIFSVQNIKNLICYCTYICICICIYISFCFDFDIGEKKRLLVGIAYLTGEWGEGEEIKCPKYQEFNLLLYILLHVYLYLSVFVFISVFVLVMILKILRLLVGIACLTGE